MISVNGVTRPADGAGLYAGAFEWLAEFAAVEPARVRILLGTEVMIGVTAKLLITKRLRAKIETVAEAVEASSILALYFRARLKAAKVNGFVISEAIPNPKLPASFEITVRLGGSLVRYQWQRDRIAYERSGGKPVEWYDDANEKDVADLIVAHLTPTEG